MQLSLQETYAVAKAMFGKDWQHLQVRELLRQMLNNVKSVEDGHTLLNFLGPEATLQVMAVKAEKDPPQSSTSDDKVVVPELPEAARLSDVALKSAEQVGSWVTEFSEWAVQRTPMTPKNFLEAGAIWSIGLAVARRASIVLHAPIYPHLYILWVARTSIFKKTTGMGAVADLIMDAMPHMLLPEENTPESFIGSLSGKKPQNYDTLEPYERNIDDLGRMYAAQRGILLDEASSLFGAARRDYMQGLAEMLMRLYDAPARYTRNIRSEGKIVVRNASLSILGASTPAAIRRNTDETVWETGELARYVLLVPDGILPYDTGNGDHYKVPTDLVARLSRLHKALPKPPDQMAILGQEAPRQEIFSARIDADAHDAYKAYAKAVNYDMLLDKRLVEGQLHPNYSRHHIQAVKVALSLAAIDWSDRLQINRETGQLIINPDDPIRITLGHWARAQQIAEKWRTSLHQLMYDIRYSDDDTVEGKILDHLAVFYDGETLRDLTRRTKMARKPVQEALKALIESGLVEECKTDGGRTSMYRLR